MRINYPVFRYLTGAFFIGTGALHLVHPAPFLKIMPPFIPAPETMVLFSGLAEIAGGLGLFLPRFARAAAWGLVALLIAVFPANVYMATNHIQITRNPLPTWVELARLPLQALMIWWVLQITVPRPAENPGRS